MISTRALGCPSLKELHITSTCPTRVGFLRKKRPELRGLQTVFASLKQRRAEFIFQPCNTVPQALTADEQFFGGFGGTAAFDDFQIIPDLFGCYGTRSFLPCSQYKQSLLSHIC